MTLSSWYIPLGRVDYLIDDSSLGLRQLTLTTSIFRVADIF
jgi:hypothetical protein